MASQTGSVDDTAVATSAAGIGVLIPALNCAATITAVVSDAARFLRPVLVVDDGSTDSTARLAAEAGADVISHPVNSGKGAALLTGMREFSRRGISRAVTMDGDGQHLGSQIPVLLAASNGAPKSLIIGRRILEGVPTTAVRRFGNSFADRWVEIASGRPIEDTQSGFRVYPIELILQLPLRSQRFAFETEVLIRATRAGVDIETVPTLVYYPPVGERVSHYRPLADTVRIIFVVLGLIFRVW